MEEKEYKGGRLMPGFGCRRLLDNPVLAEDFVQKIFDAPVGFEDIAEKIVNAELGLAKLEASPSKTHTQYRTGQYRNEEMRKQLRRQILKELIDKEQLERDDDIKLGYGGAKPCSPQQNLQAYIVSGPPASGKSAIADQLARDNGAYMLDSDYAKRKFPEYLKYPGGASLVHQESDEIVFGPENSLFEYCVYSQHNVVIPLVGRTYKSVKKVCNRLISTGYKIHIINVALDRYKCTHRAYKRFEDTKRYVPLSYVFDEVGNEPELIYFRLKRDYIEDPNFLSFSQLSTDVKLGESAKVLEATALSPFLVTGRKEM